MPYIEKENREYYKDMIGDVVEELLDVYDENTLDKTYLAGELNYVISSIVWKLFDNKPSYTNGNTLVGVLECVKQEFIRRKLNQYEDKKIAQNGDLS